MKPCAFCSAEGNTREHVPPSCFFPPGNPDLITVPACRECNNSKSPDDEYVRNILAAGEFMEGKKGLDSVVDKASRSLVRGKFSENFKALFSSAFVEPVYDGSEDRIGFQADAGRINRWARFLFDGLFYDANHQPIHLARRHRVFWLNSELGQPYWPEIKNLACAIRDQGRLVKKIANGKFQYWDVHAKEYYASLCDFYGTYAFLCLSENCFGDHRDSTSRSARIPR